MNGFCDHKDCKALSDVRPVLLIFAPAPHDCPARGAIFKEYCATHGNQLTADYFVPDENWERICREFRAIGRMQPDRSRLRLVLEPVMHAERN